MIRSGTANAVKLPCLSPVVIPSPGRVTVTYFTVTETDPALP